MELNLCCRTNLEKMFLDVVGIFNKNNLHYWLDWGGLLGLVRDNQLLPYDKDIDFGIFIEDIDKYNSLVKQVKNKGYILTPIQYQDLFSKDKFVPRIHMQTEHCGEVCSCEIFVWQKKYIKKEQTYAVLLNCSKFIFCKLNYYTNLCNLLWKGTIIKIPENSEQYLEMRYGPTWKVPDPNYYKNHNHQIGSVL